MTKYLIKDNLIHNIIVGLFTLADIKLCLI